MSTLSNWFRSLVSRQIFRKRQTYICISSSHVRTYTDTPDVHSKQVTGTENEERVRVRRARPADVPRVLRFVREHARSSWPGLADQPAAPHLMLCDYVARALAQGHSMLAEQQEARRGWTQIRGLALGVAVCPWDASMIEKWSRCVQCARSRRLLHFTAHCLRAPALHHKYKVHNILQVIIIVPPSNSKDAEIINVLAKNAIKRGKDTGFPIIRFDVTSDSAGKTLEELQLKKEYQLYYDIVTDGMKEQVSHSDAVRSNNSDKDNSKPENTKLDPAYKHQIVVYSAVTQPIK